MSAPVDDPCTRYWALAYDAIRQGIISHSDALQIARIGHRKQAYWRRHLRDLEAIIAQRKEEHRCQPTA